MLPLAAGRDSTVDLVLDALRVVAFNTADGWMRDALRGAGGRVRVRPSPRKWRRYLMAASSATTQGLHARPGAKPSLVRPGMSVA